MRREEIDGDEFYFVSLTSIKYSFLRGRIQMIIEIEQKLLMNN